MQKKISPPLSSIAVSQVHDSEEQHVCAIDLAHQLCLPLADIHSKEYTLFLVPTGGRLELRQTGPDGCGPVYVDFAGSAMRYRIQHGGGIRQPLARAVGIRAGKRPSVLDVTAGFGRDAFVLASLGCCVTMVERSPIVTALLEDGLRRALTEQHTKKIVVERLKLIKSDSILYMQQINKNIRPETIYLDPMHPQRVKTSLVKKEMRVLRLLVGDDQDAPSLLTAALAAAGKRVVVKRPRLAESIGGPKPTMAVRGKRSRFDIYLVQR